MSGILKLLVMLWCWNYNRNWLRRGEQEYFLKQLERQQQLLSARWERMVGNNRGRHALREAR